MKRFLFLLAAVSLLASTAAIASDASSAANLDQLLDLVRKSQGADSELNKKRETQFRAARDQQAALLNRAKQELAALELDGAHLQAQLKRNEQELARLVQQKNQRVGDLSELFVVARQVSADTAAHLKSSLISAQFSGREKLLEQLAQSNGLPTLADLELLRFEMQREMTEQGKVVRFQSNVTTNDGQLQAREVVRIGVFNLLQNNEYAIYRPESNQIQELRRQPEMVGSSAADFQSTHTGLQSLYLDPTRGTLMNIESLTPSWRERFDQGGLVGYIIIFGVLVLGLFIVIERTIFLTKIARRIDTQLNNIESPRDDNPLGRIANVYLANQHVDNENLELKLDEAIMKEVPQLDRGIAMVKVCAAIGPLLGLLGTVQGMIQTLQDFTSFGAGDPKLMATGVATALVTTVQGLCTAIPLVYLHAYVSAKARGITQILEQQSTGMLARHFEK